MARFVLVRGALGWGLTTALIYSLLMWGIAGADLRVLLPLSLLLFPLGGLLWGAAMWWHLERRYRRHLQAGEAGR
ncbi:hypothetical protein WQ53_09990 [Pseudoxanthomonas suwonensis]|uniref:Transmembrane protein n=2 Tax=Pseudoxanthomonas suwonensis TaxID=314722 RepID=A0A0E3Z1E0_9GAMM|nr:hypothetical protein WQ53_09990 [Pseudoxanthomonas suwonensis]